MELDTADHRRSSGVTSGLHRMLTHPDWIVSRLGLLKHDRLAIHNPQHSEPTRRESASVYANATISEKGPVNRRMPVHDQHRQFRSPAEKRLTHPEQVRISLLR